MTNTIQGQLVCPNEPVAIVVSRFNDLITGRLVDGAVGTIERHGGNREKVDVVHVPGSFEIPLAAKALAESGRYKAVICVGAVIQGSTTHHEYINSQVAAGIMSITQNTGVPVTFGVITCESMEQALDRAGGKVGNKGEEATLAAIEMMNLLPRIR
ncbi:MAG: 6,7-dimethyl-8-ribityllumazine synthase [Planctomycetaceae bacterium]|nr:6,7-dimethyl-8-ribityllumazine synthase [Planctomycetaceae bacterium]